MNSWEATIFPQAKPPVGIEDVPDVMAELYLETLNFAKSTPSWIQDFFAFYTEASLVLMLGLLALTWWFARQGHARRMAWSLLAPVALVVAYLTSEWSKTLVEVDRPCRMLQVQALVVCPPHGDWSLPSNHSTIAGAIAIGILIAWPKLGLLSVPIGLLAAYSRVFVGVHYPHDAVIGFLLGGVIAVVLMILLVRPVTLLVGRLREHPTIGILLAHKAQREPEAAIPDQRAQNPHHLPSYGPGPGPGPHQPTEQFHQQNRAGQ